VAVPTHYFKVVLAENSSGKYGQHKAAVGAFVMPNSAIDPATPVTAFAVPLDALESAAGAPDPRQYPGLITSEGFVATESSFTGKVCQSDCFPCLCCICIAYEYYYVV
jgi:DNA/RNA endonuclease G (NUC1)